MDTETRIALESGLRKVETDIAVLKILAQAGRALQVFKLVEEAQASIRDAIVEMIPDSPLQR